MPNLLGVHTVRHNAVMKNVHNWEKIRFAIHIFKIKKKNAVSSIKLISRSEQQLHSPSSSHGPKCHIKENVTAMLPAV